jgi:lipoprotein-anchoring transpeptidase ErfK/SrfK
MLKTLVATVVALVLPASALAVSQVPPKPIVGAGTINVVTLKVHTAPSAGSRIIARLSEFRPQDYEPRYVIAVGVKLAAKKKIKQTRARKTATVVKPSRPAWYKITIPGRPNGRTGWVHADQVSIRRMPWQVVVFRGSRILQLWKDDALIFSSKVAVGAPGMETPTGLYFVTHRFRPVKEPFLGAYAFETSAYSKLSEWPGGGVVGVHGWNDASVFGKAVSHGCIRVPNHTATFLRDRIPVGTPIRIVPT